MSAISLAVVFYFADIGQMLKALRLADYRIVAAAFLVSLVWLLVRAMFWRTLLQERASFSKVFFTITEGYLLNNVLPFRLGEVARAFLLSGKTELTFWEVFSTILIERALDMTMAAGLLLVTLPFVIGANWAHQAAIAVGTIVPLGLLVLYLLARYREWATRVFVQLVARWPVLGKIGVARVASFLSGLAVLTDGSRFLRAVGWALLNWLIAIAQYYVLLLAFFPNASLLWAAFALGVAALGIAAPSSPGAVGVLELSIVGALAVFGLNSSTALAYALTGHLFNYLTNGILGAYALAKDGETLTGLYQSVRNIRSTVSEDQKTL